MKDISPLFKAILAEYLVPKIPKLTRSLIVKKSISPIFFVKNSTFIHYILLNSVKDILCNIGCILKDTNFYLNREQFLKKYKFISANMLKNMLSKKKSGFREKCIKKWGKRILIDELAFLKFISEQPFE